MNLKDALEKTTDLQSKLYQAAKADPKRRFHRLYDKLFREDVLWTAWGQVRANNGASGIDGQTIKSVEETGVASFLRELGESLRTQTYRPGAVRRVAIPKGEGKLRLLGIPTLRDRVAQTACKLIMEPIFDADFSRNSFGFRPGIGQPEALKQISSNARQGYCYVADADIEGFFDNLDHDLLMERLRRRISDGAVLRLIYRWLKAGMLDGGDYEETDRGTPQGGPLSPLLANIYLHDLDQLMEQKSFLGRMTRYADDFVIQCQSLAHAKAALGVASRHLRQLKLRLHFEKTRIVEDQTTGFDFLGFYHRRVPLRTQLNRPLVMLRWPSKKSCQKFRDRIKAILHSAGGVRTAAEWHLLKEQLNNYIRGWGYYFRRGHGTRILRKLDRYVTMRTARYLVRQQPTGKGRKQRTWPQFADRIERKRNFRKLSVKADWVDNPYRGKANVQWRAV